MTSTFRRLATMIFLLGPPTAAQAADLAGLWQEYDDDTGAMVALALPGAKIAQDIHSSKHEPFVLEKAKIRGIESQGMILAATDEKGISVISPDRMVQEGSIVK